MGHKRHSAEDVERGLVELAVCGGSTTQASEATGIPSRTLQRWKNRDHAERYQVIVREQLPKAYARVADRLFEGVHRKLDLATKLEERLEETAAELSGSDAARAMQQLAVSLGINVDKTLLLRGEPTKIVEHRNADEILDAMRRKGWLDPKDVEATDVEIHGNGTPAELTEGSDDDNPDE